MISLFATMFCAIMAMMTWLVVGSLSTEVILQFLLVAMNLIMYVREVNPQ